MILANKDGTIELVNELKRGKDFTLVEIVSSNHNPKSTRKIYDNDLTMKVFNSTGDAIDWILEDKQC